MTLTQAREVLISSINRPRAELVLALDTVFRELDRVEAQRDEERRRRMLADA
jgi:hypothetical protein